MLKKLQLLLLLTVASHVVGFSLGDPFALVNADEVAKKNESKEENKFKASSVLTTTEFELFNRSISLAVDANCAQDLNKTLWSIASGYRWAIAMYDATVKSSVGIESGMLYQFGHYDECLRRIQPDANEQILENNNNNNHMLPVRTQYCLTNVTLDGMTVHNMASRKKPMNTTIAHWGACVPASCSASDVEIFLKNFLQRRVAVDATMCEVREPELHVTNAMYSYALVIFFFIFLAIISTAYHAFLLYKRCDKDSKPCAYLLNDTWNMAFISFSIIENTKKLFQASKDQLGLNSINGIKALAMLIILAGHALSFICGGPVYNAEFIDEHIKLPTFAFLSNSLLFVDTFLLLSGFLFCRILLIELERRRGKINVLVLYVARYIRLTPAYMAIIGFYMTWFSHAGSGPIWRQRIEREQERCNSSWWLNILYINNYINTENLCMFQSWYLSVDSQLFFIAPAVIFFLYKSRKHGLRFLAALVALTATIPFIVTYIKKLDPTLLVYADEMSDLGSNAFYIGTYIKTHMRASAYVIGLLAGYIVHLMQEKGTKLPRIVVQLIWFCSIGAGVASMYTVCRFYSSPYNNLESTMYAGFHKLGWNLSVAWLVVAATTGHAGCLQKVLSNRVFAPFSRLTYCAYLCNGIVELYHSSNIRRPHVMGIIGLTNDVLCHVLDTFILAFVVCLLFESPIHALERILLRNAGRQQRQERKNEQDSSHTPSTSEEQVA